MKGRPIWNAPPPVIDPDEEIVCVRVSFAPSVLDQEPPPDDQALAYTAALDSLGLLHNCPRESGEDDKTYAPRLRAVIRKGLTR